MSLRLSRVAWLLALFASSSTHAAGSGDPVIIQVLLDNSPSMNIGATPGDIAAMMHLTPCSEPGAMNPYHDWPFGGMSKSMQTYSAYQCWMGRKYDGHLPPFNEQACPIPAPKGIIGQATLTPGIRGPRCNGLVAERSGPVPTAGAPCAFACHWDSHLPLSASRDYYGLARSTIGQPPCYQEGAVIGACGITLRSDLVKNAVARLIETIEEDDFAGAAKFSLSVFAFDTALHAVYPLQRSCGDRNTMPCISGRDWALALGSVGTAPDLPSTIDAGIQPVSGMNQGATDLPKALTTLAREDSADVDLTQPGRRVRKALFLITDGLDDHVEGGVRTMGAIDPHLCQVYKSAGFKVFVLDTPYYPLMNPFYLMNVSRFAEGGGPGSVAFSLRQCASDPVNSFIEAKPTDPSSISKALQTFLKRTMQSN